MSKNKQAGIYKITCVANNKVYIGQSIDIETRIIDHTRRLKTNKHKNIYLQNAWNKYSEADFKFDIAEVCVADYSVLNEREIYWINHFNSLDKDCGFNLASGGGNGYSLAGKTKTEITDIYKKIAKARLKKWEESGNPRKGFVMSDEQKKNIKEFMLSGKNPFRDKKKPEHSRLMTGAGNSRARPVICITTGEIFLCAKDAGYKSGTTNSNILKCCKGVQSYAGKSSDNIKLVWKYTDEQGATDDN